MFRINKLKHRQHDTEHGKTIDVKNLYLYRWINTRVFQGLFSSAGKHKGEEESEIPFNNKILNIAQ